MEIVEFQGDFGAHRYAGFCTKIEREWAVDYDDETQTFILVAHSEGYFPRAQELIESIKQQDGFHRGDFSECVNQACKRMDESVTKLRAGKGWTVQRGVVPTNTAIIIIRSDRLVAAGQGAIAVYMRRPNAPLRLLLPTASTYSKDFLTEEMAIPFARALLLITDIEGEYEFDQLGALLKYDTPLQDLRYAAVDVTKETVGPFSACCCIQLHWQQAAHGKAVSWVDHAIRQDNACGATFNPHKAGGDEEDGAYSSQVL